MSLKETLLNTFCYQAEAAGKTHSIYAVAEELELLEETGDFFAHENTYGELSVTLSFYGTYSSNASETMALMAKRLLPKLGELRKEFDETQNRMRLVAEYKGVKIVLEAEPPKTCSVEKITETIEVPEQIIPAHVEKKVRYVLSGDCDPLMQPTGAA